jgi:hypothetical protein
MTKSRAVTAILLAVSFFAASPALADVQVLSVTAPATITDPNSIFTINYTLGGSKISASAQVYYYLATTATGTASSGRVLLRSSQILLSSGGGGIYRPPSGTQTASFSRATVQSGAQAQLDYIMTACQPQTWYIQVQVDFAAPGGDDTLIGTTRLPDFYFTAGTLSPTTVQPGGSTSFSFSLYTKCPANSASSVGVYLADANYNLLSYIGGLSISPGSGTYSSSPTTITLSPSIAPGSYNLVLISDDTGVIAESNENNNAGAFAFTVAPSTLTAFGQDESPLLTNVPAPAEAASIRDDSGATAADDYVQKF